MLNTFFAFQVWYNAFFCGVAFQNDIKKRNESDKTEVKLDVTDLRKKVFFFLEMDKRFIWSDLLAHSLFTIKPTNKGILLRKFI